MAPQRLTREHISTNCACCLRAVLLLWLAVHYSNATFCASRPAASLRLPSVHSFVHIIPFFWFSLIAECNSAAAVVFLERWSYSAEQHCDEGATARVRSTKGAKAVREPKTFLEYNFSLKSKLRGYWPPAPAQCWQQPWNRVKTVMLKRKNKNRHKTVSAASCGA